MVTLQALLMERAADLGAGYKKLGKTNGLFLKYDVKEGWSLKKLGCFGQLFRWCGCFKNTRLGWIDFQLNRAENVPVALKAKIQASWEKKSGKLIEYRLDEAVGVRSATKKVGMTNITICKGDITAQDVDVIVNAANPSCLGKGGVSGAIFRIGGPPLERACEELPLKGLNVRCLTGESVITGKGNLPDPIRYVIHTVGPVHDGNEQRTKVLLAKAYESALLAAYITSVTTKIPLKKIALPAISAGIYGFGVDRSLRVGIEVAQKFAKAAQYKAAHFEEIRFVVLHRDVPDITALESLDYLKN